MVLIVIDELAGRRVAQAICDPYPEHTTRLPSALRRGAQRRAERMLGLEAAYSVPSNLQSPLGDPGMQKEGMSRCLTTTPNFFHKKQLERAPRKAKQKSDFLSLKN